MSKKASKTEKSIKNQRLVYKITTWFIIRTLISYIITIALIICFLPLFKLFDGPYGYIERFLCSGLLILWMLTSIYLKNKLVRIEGKNLAENKENILSTMDNFFSKYDFKINNEKMMRSSTPTNRSEWGRLITILFDDKIMYLNITTLSLLNWPILTHGPVNFIMAKRIAKYYREYYLS